MRQATITRTTRETQIELSLNIDGAGLYNVDNPIGFFSHMLNSFCTHGLFDLKGTIKGDLYVDMHHTIEDTGIVLGQLFKSALGDCKGIYRAANFLYPMDEALVSAAVDFGGRGFLILKGLGETGDVRGNNNPPLIAAAPSNIGDFQTDCVEDFWEAFTANALCALHLNVLYGRSTHHIIEGMFKAASRAIRAALELDPRRKDIIPSTKGVIV